MPPARRNAPLSEVLMSRFNRCHAITVAVLAGVGAAPGTAQAQGTPADYARAVGLRAKYEAVAIDVAGAPSAIGRTHRFWYRKSVRGGDQFVLVDGDTQQKQPAFDH